jgi:hypothetical protein
MSIRMMQDQSIGLPCISFSQTVHFLAGMHILMFKHSFSFSVNSEHATVNEIFTLKLNADTHETHI